MSPSRRQSQTQQRGATTGDESESKRHRRSRSSSDTATRDRPDSTGPSTHYDAVDRSNSPTSPREYSGSFSTSPTSSKAGPSRGGRPENLTVRRREANRLAAQRFRSRKKGYQESLEEKVRELQEENAILLGRLEGRQDTLYGDTGVVDGARPRPIHRASGEWAQHGSAADIRMAALDSANRRLQEENRALEEEVQKVNGELEMWRRWANQHPQKPGWAQDPPPLHRAQSLETVPRPLPTFSDIRSSTLNNHMPPPTLPPPLNILGVNSASSSGSSGSSVRLPPIRMTPPSTGHPILPSPNLPSPLSSTETKPSLPPG